MFLPQKSAERIHYFDPMPKVRNVRKSFTSEVDKCCKNKKIKPSVFSKRGKYVALLESNRQLIVFSKINKNKNWGKCCILYMKIE